MSETAATYETATTRQIACPRCQIGRLDVPVTLCGWLVLDCPRCRFRWEIQQPRESQG